MAGSRKTKRRVAKIALGVAIYGALQTAYFAMFYGWLTATPAATEHLRTLQRLCYANFWLAVAAFGTAIAICAYLLRTRGHQDRSTASAEHGSPSKA